LTINPETGLPEAGFLKNILPMIAGAGLAMIPGVGPLMAAGLVGGGTTIATGSLEKGLMAGLGAYGGAGLGAGLANLGTGSISQAAGAGLSEEAAQQAIGNKLAQSTMTDKLTAGAKYAFDNPMNALKGIGSGSAMKGIGTIGMAAAPLLAGMGEGAQAPGIKPTTPTTPLQYNANPVGPTPQADVPGYGNLGQDFGRQRRYFNHQFTPTPPVAPITTMPIVNDLGGGMAAGGPVEAMSAANVYDMQNARGGVSDMGIDNSTGMQRMADGGQINLQGTLNLSQGNSGGGQFGQINANGYQAAGGGFDPRAISANPQGFQKYMQQMQRREQRMPGSTMLGGSNMQAGYGGTAENGFMSRPGDGLGQPLGPMTMDVKQPYNPQADQLYKSFMQQANQPGFDNRFAAGGGISAYAGGGYNLGDYSDGGRLLRGPGNGTSDSIPAVIGEKRPARLADGEFVLPARIVSEIGNGSTEAGARKLYAMMDRIQKARGKTVGKGKVAVDAKARNELPA
jgi:hypothetical protein